MSSAHNGLKISTTILACALIIALWFLVVLVQDYKYLDRTVAKCYGAAEASTWSAIAYEAEAAGVKDTFRQATIQVTSTLNILDEASFLEAMATCDDLFWKRNPS